MAGWAFLAVLNKSRTREAPTPTNISINSLPAIEKNWTSAPRRWLWPTASYLSPTDLFISTPLGVLAPIALYFPGFFKKSTTSLNSCLASSTPATSLKLNFGLSLLKTFAFDWPKEKHAFLCASGLTENKVEESNHQDYRQTPDKILIQLFKVVSFLTLTLGFVQFDAGVLEKLINIGGCLFWSLNNPCFFGGVNFIRRHINGGNFPLFNIWNKLRQRYRFGGLPRLVLGWAMPRKENRWKWLNSIDNQVFPGRLVWILTVWLFSVFLIFVGNITLGIITQPEVKVPLIPLLY